jgi:hypothetical protein
MDNLRYCCRPLRPMKTSLPGNEYPIYSQNNDTKPAYQFFVEELNVFYMNNSTGNIESLNLIYCLGNGLAALTAFTLEALILSIRLFVYYYYEEDRSKNLARKVAISPEDFLQQMIQAGFGSLSAFGMSIAGIVIGSTFFVSSMAPMVCSIFFGFIGYIAARWLTGIIVIKIKKKLAWLVILIIIINYYFVFLQE